MRLPQLRTAYISTEGKVELTLSHAAALALVGWYLMQPPGMDATVPLNQWPIHHRFHSIAECEARIHKLDEMARSSAYQARLGSLGLSAELEHGNFAVRNWKCIS